MLQSEITALQREFCSWKYWEDIGYFQPDLYNKDNAATVTIRDEIFYRDIYLWIEQIEKVAKIKGKKLVARG